MIAAFAILGVLLLPVTYFGVPAALSQPIPITIGGKIGYGIAWAIVLLGPLFLLMAVGSYVQRREAITGKTPFS